MAMILLQHSPPQRENSKCHYPTEPPESCKKTTPRPARKFLHQIHIHCATHRGDNRSAPAHRFHPPPAHSTTQSRSHLHPPRCEFPPAPPAADPPTPDFQTD